MPLQYTRYIGPPIHLGKHSSTTTPHLAPVIMRLLHVVFNEIIPNPTDEYFAELEGLMVDVVSESRDSFLVGMQGIDDEDGLVYETTR